MITISPFTGGPVEIRKEQTSVKYKDRLITYEKEFYYCLDTEQQFVDEEIEQKNLDRMWEQIYKDKL